MVRRALVALALILAITQPKGVFAQSGVGDGSLGSADVIRGRVLTQDGAPVSNAAVTVTGLESHIVRSTKSNSQGLYTILFANGEGEYVIAVKAIGMAPMKKRVLRTDEGNVLITDFSLEPLASKLQSVNIQADAVHVRPPLTIGDGRSVGGNERDVTAGALFSLDPSDFRTLLQGLPGVTILPKGYSVLGAAPDQNSTLLNGSTFTGDRIPEDAIQSANFATATYDPSRGGFAGGQTLLTTKGGSNMHEATIRATYNDSRLVWNDPQYPITPSRSQSWSGSLSGPLKENEAFYFLAFQVDHSHSDLLSLLNLNKAAIAQSGLILDTVQSVNNVLQQIGVPLTTSGIPRTQRSLSQSVSANLNAAPTATTTFNVSAVGSWSRQDGAGISALSYPAFGSGTWESNGTFQLATSMYLESFLNEFHSAVSSSRNITIPYVTLPGGTVQVPSQYADGRQGITALEFGGSTTGRSISTETSLELTNATSWLSLDSRHQVKLAESVNLSRAATSPITDQFGTYVYQSLTDLAANHPASYTRTLDSPPSYSSVTQSSISLGDVYQESKRWQFQYGVRVDIGNSGIKPSYNPLVDSLFGRRTDAVPRDIALSPRLGFSWNQWGDQDITALTQDALAHGKPVPLPLTVSGGFGEFGGVLDPLKIAQLVNATGLPNTVRQLSCVGAAVPIPNWSQFSSDSNTVPTQCLDGTAPMAFSTDRPNVQLYDQTYRAPASWRGNIALGGLHVGEWPISVNSEYNLGLHGESMVDLNLRHAPVYALAGEGGRPMYVPTDAIVPMTGAIAPGASRISDQFGSVMSTQSDLKSLTEMVSLTTNSPRPFFGKVPISITYTLSRSRAQFRDIGGFNPLAIEWSTGQQPTHQINISTSFSFWHIGLNAQILVNSGVPYTPVVNADVNGDGLLGDRAFVFNPATTADTALASQMSKLLASSDPRVRQCLESQLGSIAGHNSCHTAWQLLFQPNLNLKFGLPNPSKSLTSFNDRLKFSLQTENTMSVVSRVLGLSNAPLIRNTGYMPLDPTLLYVTGYDPVKQRFLYQVNQQFGDTRRRVNTNGRAIQPPFRAYLTGELSLGGPPHRTLAQGLGLVPIGDEEQLPVDSVRARLRALTVNPVGQLLDLQDSLFLSQQQVADIQQISTNFDMMADSLLEPIAEYVFARGRATDDGQLSKQIAKVQEKMTKAMIRQLKSAIKILTPEQQEHMPSFFKAVLAMKVDS